MDRLEKHIQTNRDQFNDLEPEDGHFKRFREKLSKYHRQKNKFPWTVYLKAAAVALLVVLSGLWVQDQIQGNQNQERLALERVSPELKEAHIYYTSLMEKKYERIQEFNFKNEAQKKMLLEELREMDAIYSNIREDLMTNPNDPRVVSALIRHYQMKLEVMNQIVQQLEKINTPSQNNDQKNTSYETTQM